MTAKNDFPIEHQLTTKCLNDIERFWQTGEFSHFVGVDKIRINYAAFTQSEDNPCIVISPGRCESYIKYKELAYDITQQGYQVFIIDHRGQGLSERMTMNNHKGYVKKFDDYVEDLYQFVSQIVTPQCKNQKPFLLAHSMGGAIAARLLQKYPYCISATVLSSPMIAINSGLLPAGFAKSLIKSADCFNRIVSNIPWYFIGQGNYKTASFTGNNLTHSKGRYQRFIELYQKYPAIQLGGVTTHWLRQAIKNQEVLFTEIDKITSPIFIIHAGNDTIVDNKIQSDFCHQLHLVNPQLCTNKAPLIIDGAHHELFFEQDKYRTPALIAALSWFKQYQTYTHNHSNCSFL